MSITAGALTAQEQSFEVMVQHIKATHAAEVLTLQTALKEKAATAAAAARTQEEAHQAQMHEMNVRHAKETSALQAAVGERDAIIDNQKSELGGIKVRVCRVYIAD